MVTSAPSALKASPSPVARAFGHGFEASFPLSRALRAVLEEPSSASAGPWFRLGRGRGVGAREETGMEITVLVEVPMGSRNKYEMDHRLGRLRLDRTLFTATRYPADYGYVPSTLAEDGDPLDALVLTGEPTFPGCEITARP